MFTPNTLLCFALLYTTIISAYFTDKCELKCPKDSYYQKQTCTCDCPEHRTGPQCGMFVVRLLFFPKPYKHTIK